MKRIHFSKKPFIAPKSKRFLDLNQKEEDQTARSSILNQAARVKCSVIQEVAGREGRAHKCVSNE
jgi:hypothetical protein